MRWMLVLLLAACASPSPKFMGAERQDISVGDRQFTMYRQGSAVQLIRHGFATPSERARLLVLMPAVVQAQTGCTVIPNSVTGDAGVMQARLRC